MGWRPRLRLQILGGRVKRSLAGQAKPTETRATPMEIPELLLPTCGEHVDIEDGCATANKCRVAARIAPAA